MHKNNSEALDESFEKLAVLAVLVGKTEKTIPKELVPYVAFHVGFAEENSTHGLLNDNNNSNLQNFAYAFRTRLNSKIIKENDTPLQNRRFGALGRLIQYNNPAKISSSSLLLIASWIKSELSLLFTAACSNFG